MNCETVSHTIGVNVTNGTNSITKGVESLKGKEIESESFTGHAAAPMASGYLRRSDYVLERKWIF
jgi:hypothetical protein